VNWMTDYALWFDAGLAFLLLITIWYAAVLNRKLTDLRKSKEEFESLFKQIAEATAAAEKSIGTLKITSDTASLDLQQKEERIRGLSEDLTFLVERAEGEANRLDLTISSSREASPPSSGPRNPFSKAKPRGSRFDEAAREIPEPRQGPRLDPRVDHGLRESSGPARPEPRNSAPSREEGAGLSSAQSDLLKALQGIR